LSVKLLVEFTDQIHWSNCWIKSVDQTQAILGPMLASLGECMDAPAHGPKTGKDGRETGKEKAHAVKRGTAFNC